MNLWVFGINTVGCNKSHEIAPPSPPSPSRSCSVVFYLRLSSSHSEEHRYPEWLPPRFNLSFFAFSLSDSLRLAPGKRKWRRATRMAASAHSLARGMDDTFSIKPPECSCFQDTRMPRGGLGGFLCHFFSSSVSSSRRRPRWSR